ncbi:NAD-dependent protein deacetylase sirtuin-7-like isoform X2 [Amphiura filiformis]
MEEVEDSAEVLAVKTTQLSEAISQARHLVVYTGAGVSTAASIPDYRGPNGVWTLLQKGLDVTTTSLVDAEPTLTHMSLVKLQEKGLVQHIVSQNCDGLHLRSGFPQDALSEVHGNMYIEVCTKCKPENVYTRLFDVTERTAKFRHDTGRKCHRCRRPLRDTIVHFGEKGAVDQPLNWKAGIEAADDADMILCLGSSLKVLRRYPFLWGTDRSKALRPKLYIVNLQWTPKDSQATLKINGKCDEVMKMVMDRLQLDVPVYQRSQDPIFSLAIQLKSAELKTFTTKMLQLSDMCNNNTDTQILTDDNLKPVCDEQLVATSPGGDTIKQDRDSKDDIKLCTLKPGWFGKGCRKRVVKRRRSSQVSIECVKEEVKEEGMETEETTSVPVSQPCQ